VKNPGQGLMQHITRAIRHYLVGPEQRWVFEPPLPGWTPTPIDKTSLYLHVPFCSHFCPYCPYTKVTYRESLLEPYTRAAVAEVDWWADRIGSAEITSIYIGGGTPTVALEGVARVLMQVRERFHLKGDICIETNPADISVEIVQRLHDMDVSLVSLGIESFKAENLAILGRGYDPAVAERALSMLARSNFSSVNADIMFALPNQSVSSLIDDLNRVAELGADQITTYPLFTFPYTSVGEYLHLAAVRMPRLGIRRAQYQAINRWCIQNGYERTSVWGFKKMGVPRYSSVTRDVYVGIGPGAGSRLNDGFVLNTFDLNSWMESLSSGGSAIALSMPFASEMAGWWWLYWRFYDTRIPLDGVDDLLGRDTPKARWILRFLIQTGLAVRNDGYVELTEPGAFWLHLAQNYFALNYVNTLWTRARQESWPKVVFI
jgi:coproporphyrinogen III oxidase-like Fe-S oxidoreductase